jgi:hypothetical protein
MIGQHATAPDLIEPVVAYREWLYDPEGEGLVSPHVKEPWHPGWMLARCRPYPYYYAPKNRDHHPAPEPACMCGLYGYHGSEYISGTVVGAVVVTGRIQVHETGVRAERAKVVALAPGRFGVLAFDSHLPFVRWLLRGHSALALTRKGRRDFRTLCDRYGAECVWDPADLPRVAAKYGKPVPMDLRVPDLSEAA